MRSVYIIIGTLVGIIACFLVYYHVHQRDQRRRQCIQQHIRTIRERVSVEKEQRSMYLANLYNRTRTRISDIIHDTSTPLETRLVNLAYIVSRGVYPVLRPDPDIATQCCRAVILHTDAVEEHRKARLLLYSMHIPDADVSDTSQPLDDELVRGIDVMIDTLSTRGYQTRQRPAKRQEIHDVSSVYEPVDDDTQNSHDSGVVTSVKQILSGLSKHTVKRDVVEEYIGTCSLDDDTKAKALYALDTLTDEEYGTGITEMDALSRVWGSGADKDTVILQLASAIEHGVPVCHSGKLGRLASALDTGETKHAIVPTWVLRRHASDIAAKVRRDVLDRASSRDREQYETEGHDLLRTQMIDAFTKDMKPHLQNAPEHIQRLLLEEYSGAF